MRSHVQYALHCAQPAPTPLTLQLRADLSVYPKFWGHLTG